MAKCVSSTGCFWNVEIVVNNTMDMHKKVVLLDPQNRDKEMDVGFLHSMRENKILRSSFPLLKPD